MGDVADLAGYRKRRAADEAAAGEKRTGWNHSEAEKQQAYSELQKLEKELFGERKDMSLLERITGELAPPEPSQEPTDPAQQELRKAQQQVNKAAFEVVGADIYQAGYACFDSYDQNKYESFLEQAATYFHVYDSCNYNAIERVVSITRALFRHQAGLPTLLDLEAINEMKRSWLGSRKYDRKEKSVNKRVERFRLEALRRANTQMFGPEIYDK